MNADGTHLRLSHNGDPVADFQGGPLFDQYGTPLEEVLLTHDVPKERARSAGPDVDSIDERDAFGRFMKVLKKGIRGRNLVYQCDHQQKKKNSVYHRTQSERLSSTHTAALCTIFTEDRCSITQDVQWLT